MSVTLGRRAAGRLLASVLTATALTAALLPGASGHAAHMSASSPTTATTYDVTAGYGNDDYAANIFNPEVLHIYVGDTVRWHVGGTLEPHDVAFGPKSTLDKLSAGLEVVVPQKAGPPTVEINPQLAIPTSGRTYDGTGLAHSGFLIKAPGAPQTWSLTFTKPGTYRYYCLVHYDPGAPAASMSGTVVVMARPTVGRMYHVESGYDNGTARVAADAFFPERLTVHVGDTVVWSPGFHTVSFGPKAMLDQLRRSFVAPVPQKSGPPVLTLNPKVVFASGGHTYDGTGFVNSGILVSPRPHTFTLTFTKPGTYFYECLIHPGMDGTITVLPAGQ